MGQIGKELILGVEELNIIEVSVGIHNNLATFQKQTYIRLDAFDIFIDIVCYCIIATCGDPIRIIVTVFEGQNDRIRIKDMPDSRENISIVHSSTAIEVH